MHDFRVWKTDVVMVDHLFSEYFRGRQRHTFEKNPFPLDGRQIMDNRLLHGERDVLEVEALSLEKVNTSAYEQGNVSNTIKHID